MFDVATMKQLEYSDGLGERRSATLFQDCEQAGRWFVLPQLRLCQRRDEPVFSVIRQTSNVGTPIGVCTFEVELGIDADALSTLENAIEGWRSWGQFLWIGGIATLAYDLDVDGTSRQRSLSVEPSLIGGNIARFQVEFESDRELDAFIDAIRGTGTSALHIEYAMRSLTKAPDNMPTDNLAGMNGGAVHMLQQQNAFLECLMTINGSLERFDDKAWRSIYSEVCDRDHLVTFRLKSASGGISQAGACPTSEARSVA